MNNRGVIAGIRKKRICFTFVLLIGSVGCHNSPPVELLLSHSDAEDVLQITIKNNSAGEVVVSRRFLTMLPRDSSELRVVVATKDGATVPMCRGLDYFGPESHLEVGAGQSVSTEIHISSLIQTHCLEKGVSYTVQFGMGRNDEHGGERQFFSNSLSLNVVVGR